jgi:2-hydroxychromene-2-carboxylate isomerase
MQEINFWFSIGSTYTYLSASRLRRVIQNQNIEFNFHPFSVRTVMKDMDNIPFPPSKKPKVDHMWRDIQRRSMIYEISVPEVPVPYPLKDLDLANSVAIVGVEEGWILQYLEETYKLWFIEHNEAGSEDNLNKSLTRIKLNPSEVIDKAKSSKIIEKYNNNTVEAKISNVFGSPTFKVGDELFWGDDRLEDAIQWAKK